MLQDSVRSFAQDQILPLAEQADETETFPEGHFQKMAEMGLLGITVPEEEGGAGMGCVQATIVHEELGAVCASTALTYLAHTILFVHNLATNGSKEQKQKYLADVISGEKIGGLGITEPGSGSDSLAMSTQAVRDGSDYLLSGTKTYITNAPNGQVFYVYARTGEGKKDISTFLVEDSFEGFSRGKKIRKMGMRGSPTGQLIMDKCRVPEANRVGNEGDSTTHMMRNLDIERITIAGISIGIARGALAVAQRYVQEREAFGKPLSKLQMIQKMYADGDAELHAAKSLVYEAAKRWDIAKSEGRALGKKEALWAARAKLIAATMATKVSLDCVQMLGGYGYDREFPVERMARDAKLNEIGAGTNEIMRVIIAREELN